ncbi:zinc finger CCCH domain-containing protein 16 isoform X2 [Carya illinoinensis]|uniref:C3H1-type domain-containing protein n=1 Tax=Carya illinoinensis TaxID=32201 RepID=A0A8T1N6T2_CARIL|nr:zinc finger CCCH domain-containing protein 16 isoform X2 [Carya illinoinensis]KAG6625742.1 hypothetical protein CIPAW_15G000100 [Carya illinoinensis]
MSFKKEPCRNFQRGHCQFGEACRYLHVTQQQPKSNVFGFGTQTGLNEQKKLNPFGFGTQTGSHQQQKSNPFGFGVQSSSHPKVGTDFVSKQNQSKLFQNTWTRSTSTPTGVAPRKSDNETQAANHKCTDPEACRRQIVEDFESERPLWKLTCYGHSKNAPCDIVGDISYEELRAAAYDDAKHGLNFQSIVERERNLLSSKLVEFDNLLRKPYAVLPSRSSSQTPFSGARPNSFPPTAQNSAPPLVSSFNQLGASQNLGLGISQASNAFGTNNLPHRSEGAFNGQIPAQTPGSSFTSNIAGFNNGDNMNAGSTSRAAAAQISNSSSNHSPVVRNGPNFSAGEPANTNVQFMNNLQTEDVSGNSSVWLKEKWNPGEIPEEAPPDAFI